MQLNASQLSPGTQPPAPHCSARTRNSLQRTSHLTGDCDHAVQPGNHAHVCHAASAPGPPAAHAARLAAAVANATASTPLYSNPGHSTAAHDWGAPATAQLLLLLAALLATLPTRLLEPPHCAPLAEAHSEAHLAPDAPSQQSHMSHSHGSDSHPAHSHAPLAEAHSEAHPAHSHAPLAEARSAARAGCQHLTVCHELAHQAAAVAWETTQCEETLAEAHSLERPTAAHAHPNAAHAPPSASDTAAHAQPNAPDAAAHAPSNAPPATLASLSLYEP